MIATRDPAVRRFKAFVRVAKGNAQLVYDAIHALADLDGNLPKDEIINQYIEMRLDGGKDWGVEKRNQRDQLLGILQEECAEIIQAISKINRFGNDGYHPDDKTMTKNIHLLAREIGDFQETLRHIELDQSQVVEGIKRKNANLRKYKVIAP